MHYEVTIYPHHVNNRDHIDIILQKIIISPFPQIIVFAFFSFPPFPSLSLSPPPPPPSQSDFTVELFRYIVWLQPCVCAAEWPLRAPVSNVALSMRRMSLTSVQLLSEREATPATDTTHTHSERGGWGG